MNRHISCFLVVMLAVVLLTGSAPRATSQFVLSEEKVLHAGDSEILSCKNVTRMAIADPLVADVKALSSGEILLNAIAPGKTVLHVWDAMGRHTYNIEVQPMEIDVARLADDVKAQLDDPRVSVRAIGNTLILEGIVSTEAEAGRAEAIAKAVVEKAVFNGPTSGSKSQEVKTVSRPEGDSFVVEKNVVQKDAAVDAKMSLRCPKVVNLIKVEKPLNEVSVRTMEVAEAIRQALMNPALTVRALPGSVVMVEGRVGTKAELERIDCMLKGWVKEGKDDKGSMDTRDMLSEKVTIVNGVSVDTSLARQVMVHAQVVDINRTALKQFGVDWGRVVFQQSNIPGVAATATVQDQPFLIGQSSFGPFDIFGGGAIQRFDPIGARVRALEQQNKAKVLSEPNLLVVDGEEAKMLVGGEIPIPVVQSAQIGGFASVTVVFKEFGVRLGICPLVTGDGLLQLRIMPEVSALDFANAVTFSGFVIPALRTRRAETTVNVRDGQSLILGGLIQNEQTKLVKQIPVLGSLPIIGELFKSRTFQNNESELVIIVTPQIVKPNAQNTAPK